MALVDFIFKNRNAQIGGLPIDATIRERHTSTSICTDNPVEGGATITDHVAMKPFGLELEGVITDTPVTFSIIDSAMGVINTVKGFFGGKSRSLEAYEKLMTLQFSRIPFTVVTGLKTFKNMIMEDFSIDRDASTGNAIYFTARLKQITYAVAKTTSMATAGAGSPAEGSADLASGTIDKGSQVTKGASSAVSAGAGTLLTAFAALA